MLLYILLFFFFQAEDGIRDLTVTGVQTCALPISGGIELPEALAHEVVENGVELAAAIDRFAGAVGIRDAQGAWGVLSNNFITRQEAFRVAVLAAFAPFYNEKMYRPAAARSAASNP